MQTERTSLLAEESKLRTTAPGYWSTPLTRCQDHHVDFRSNEVGVRERTLRVKFEVLGRSKLVRAGS